MLVIMLHTKAQQFSELTFDLRTRLKVHCLGIPTSTLEVSLS